MCKDCGITMLGEGERFKEKEGIYRKNTEEENRKELLENLEKHRRKYGFSGYPGASVVFNLFLDDKETIDAIVYTATKLGYEDIMRKAIEAQDEYKTFFKQFFESLTK